MPDPLFLAGLAALALLTVSPGVDTALIAKVMLEQSLVTNLLTWLPHVGGVDAHGLLRPARGTRPCE